MSETDMEVLSASAVAKRFRDPDRLSEEVAEVAKHTNPRDAYRRAGLVGLSLGKMLDSYLSTRDPGQPDPACEGKDAVAFRSLYRWFHKNRVVVPKHRVACYCPHDNYRADIDLIIVCGGRHHESARGVLRQPPPPGGVSPRLSGPDAGGGRHGHH